MTSILYPKDFKEVPWKNGQGTTREIFRIAYDNEPDQFYFRISVASVSKSGPFSQFPGKDRFLMLLEGKGFRLSFEDQSEVVLANAFDSIEFEGEENIECHLIDKAAVDFNVMTQRGWGESSVTLSPLKMNQQKKYQPKNETYLYLYQTAPKLIIIAPGEVYEFKASENMVVIEVELKKIHH